MSDEKAEKPDAEKPAVVSGGHIFQERDDGSLRFVGDFEGLYQADPDPWGQLGGDERMAAYYAASRAGLTETLRRQAGLTAVAEIGCGFGQVCRQLADSLPGVRVTGCDISATATARARSDHPDLRFLQGDIADPATAAALGPQDAIILNQVLWYVLETLPAILDNARADLRPGGRLIICNAFMRTPQRYGREIINGFDGLIGWLAANKGDGFRFVSAQLTRESDHLYDDGLVVLERTEPAAAA